MTKPYSNSVDLTKDKCVLREVSYKNGEETSTITAWVTPRGLKTLDIKEDYVFNREEVYVFYRQEDMYGIPSVLRDKKLPLIAGSGDVPRKPYRAPVRVSRTNEITMPISDEPMADRGQSVVFNVRDKLHGEDSEINDEFDTKLVRLLCMLAIQYILPEEQTELIPYRYLKMFEKICNNRNYHHNRLPTIVANIESCFRIAKTIVPPRFLGSVYYSRESSSLHFNAQGVFFDDDCEWVSYFDDQSAEAIRNVKIRYIHNPRIAKERGDRSAALVNALEGLVKK